jgi:hypothetical protein
VCARSYTCPTSQAFSPLFPFLCVVDQLIVAVLLSLFLSSFPPLLLSFLLLLLFVLTLWQLLLGVFLPLFKASSLPTFIVQLLHALVFL